VPIDQIGCSHAPYECVIVQSNMPTHLELKSLEKGRTLVYFHVPCRIEIEAPP
jgi:hypothetical protein